MHGVSYKPSHRDPVQGRLGGHHCPAQHQHTHSPVSEGTREKQVSAAVGSAFPPRLWDSLIVWPWESDLPAQPYLPHLENGNNKTWIVGLK